LLDETAERRPKNASEDDVTVFVARANGREPRYRLRDKAEAFARSTGSLRRSINLRAERCQT
jgi:hypothetical protein